MAGKSNDAVLIQ